jgi:hypothetical protein
MINKEALLKIVLEKVKSLSKGNYLDLRNYKRDRYILVIKKNEEKFLIVENGFCKEEFTVSLDKLRRLLKKLIKKEFPRSHKVRVYLMGKYSKID